MDCTSAGIEWTARASGVAVVVCVLTEFCIVVSCVLYEAAPTTAVCRPKMTPGSHEHEECMTHQL
jgi:hypothetical protein